MVSKLTELEAEALEVVRARSGLPASAIASLLGRDRNQIRRLLMRLADRGHVIAEEEAGGRLAFYTPDALHVTGGRGMRDAPSIPRGAANGPEKRQIFTDAPQYDRRDYPPPINQGSRDLVSPNATAKVRTHSEPIEGAFKVVSERPKQTKPSLPVPYSAGPVVHQLPDPRRRSQRPPSQ
jgi:hypothetical protein